MQALIPVRVRDCSCPDTPHPDGDNVYLSPTLSFQGGLLANRQAVSQARAVQAGDSSQLESLWLETFVRFGARGWDFCDDKGPIPFDVEVLLADYSLALPVAEKANDLGYGDAAMAPFLQKPAKPSRNGRTPATTSQRVTRTPSSSG